MKILGVRIDEVSLKDARAKVGEFLNSRQTPPNLPLERGGAMKIFTPNPEMLVKAQKDEYFKQVLNLGDLNICDGNGIVLVSKLSFRLPTEEEGLRTEKSLKVIHGSDFMLEICKIAEQEGKSVYLLGSGSEYVVKKTFENLKERFPKLNIVGYHSGPKIIDHGKKIEVEGNQEVIDDINNKKPDILFVAFAFGKQEKWISENLEKMPSVKIAMGVGGSFDFVSGSIKRAPKFLRNIGLEWLWRLIRQPQRLPRILNATIRFLYLVLKNRSKKDPETSSG